MLNFPSLIDDLLTIINQFAASNRLEPLDSDFFQAKCLQIDSLRFKADRTNSFDFVLSFQERRLVGWLAHLESLGRRVVSESTDWHNAKLQEFSLVSFSGQASQVLTFTFDKLDFLARIFAADFSLHSLFDGVLDRCSAVPHDHEGSGRPFPSGPNKESTTTSTESSTKSTAEQATEPTTESTAEPSAEPTAESTASPPNPSTDQSKPPINRVLIITVKGNDEWSDLRVRCLGDWLAHVFNTFGASADQLNFDSTDALRRRLLGDSNSSQEVQNSEYQSSRTPISDAPSSTSTSGVPSATSTSSKVSLANISLSDRSSLTSTSSDRPSTTSTSSDRPSTTSTSSDVRSEATNNSSDDLIAPTPYHLVYLILPHSTKLRNSAELLSSWKQMKIIRAGRLVCDGHSDYAAYRTKLSEELRNEFDDDTVDRLIRMKLLSHRPDHLLRLDLDYKQIVFLHYNYARIYCLIQRCYRIFNSNFEFDSRRFLGGAQVTSSTEGDLNDRTDNEPRSDSRSDSRNDPRSNEAMETSKNRPPSKTIDPQIKKSASSPLLKELASGTFLEHFIGLSSLRFRLRIDQIEQLGGRVQNLLVLLCNDLSKFYQKRKVLDHSPDVQLLSFRVNLLRSLLRLMDVHFGLLAIAPIRKI